MRMLDDWIHIKLYKQPAKAALALPEGYEQNPQDEETLFEIVAIGPAVKKVKVSQTVVVSFMSGMYRFKLPGMDFKSFAVRESDVIGIV